VKLPRHAQKFWPLILLVSAACTQKPTAVPATAATPEPQSLRCAVIGGLADTGLWQELSARFEADTGHHVELAVRGPKHEIAGDYVRDKCHLIAMHASDTIVNLVADGNAVDPQPWARNDFVLVGPADDPAGVRGFTDAGTALRKVFETKNKLLVHASHGAMEVLSDVMAAEGLEFEPDSLLVRLDDKHRQMLLLADQERAYTIIGRIPFINGKVPKGNLEVMVQGDPRMRRPYLVAIAPPTWHTPAEHDAARQLAQFLRSEATQSFIANYGRGTFDNEPLFFPVTPAR
jgi:tungstate transport system substrate-binding protein